MSDPSSQPEFPVHDAGGAQAVRPHLLFRLLIPAGAIFIITCLALVAVTFGDPAAPPARFFDRYGLPLIVVEVVVMLVLTVLAMTVDRRQTLRRQKDEADCG